MAKDKASKISNKTLLEPVNRGMLNDAVDTILKGMDNLYMRFSGDVDALRQDIKGLKIEIIKNRSEINGLGNDFDGLKEEFSKTPTRKEFYS